MTGRAQRRRRPASAAPASARDRATTALAKRRRANERPNPLTAIAGQGQHDVAALGADIDAGPANCDRVLVRLDRRIEEVQAAVGVVLCGVRTSCVRTAPGAVPEVAVALPCLTSMSTTTMPAGTARAGSACGHLHQALIADGSDVASSRQCSISGLLRASTGKILKPWAAGEEPRRARSPRQRPPQSLKAASTRMSNKGQAFPGDAFLKHPAGA